jgi:uncharacterized DUF497 family protein
VYFEWDEPKNQENIRKHGLDFADAWEIFGGPLVPELDLRSDYGEIVGRSSACSEIESWL